MLPPAVGEVVRSDMVVLGMAHGSDGERPVGVAQAGKWVFRDGVRMDRARKSRPDLERLIADTRLAS